MSFTRCRTTISCIFLLFTELCISMCVELLEFSLIITSIHAILLIKSMSQYYSSTIRVIDDVETTGPWLSVMVDKFEWIKHLCCFDLNSDGFMGWLRCAWSVYDVQCADEWINNEVWRDYVSWSAACLIPRIYRTYLCIGINPWVEWSHSWWLHCFDLPMCELI